MDVIDAIHSRRSIRSYQSNSTETAACEPAPVMPPTTAKSARLPGGSCETGPRARHRFKSRQATILTSGLCI
jgi:hypothetical protein